ncbi:MAG: hypothetical protein FJ398_04660 [Verrucomicrobia bacterium]|nr:hypothetical protein [Verrucomicrobiota bacterium]
MNQMVGRACPQRAESDVFHARRSGSPGRTRPTGFMGRVQVRKEQDTSQEPGRDGFHSVPNQTLRQTAAQEETMGQRRLLAFPLTTFPLKRR